MGSRALISHRAAAAGLLLLTLLAGAVIGFSPGAHHAAASASRHVQPINAAPSVTIPSTSVPTRSAPTPTRSVPMAVVSAAGPRHAVHVVQPTSLARTKHAAPAPAALITGPPPPPRFYVDDGTSSLTVRANAVGTGVTPLHPAGLPGVALTFDDGPSPLYTPQVLDVLERYHTPATFFVVGYHALQYPDLVRAEVRAGMTVGDHSFDHPNYPPFAALTAARIDTEIAQGRNALRGLAPPPRLFRPPGGSFSLYVEATAHRLGLRVTLWSVDPTDWAAGVSSGQIVARVLGAVRPGSIVIMHDGGGNRAATVAALPAIIAGIRAKGLRLVALHN